MDARRKRLEGRVAWVTGSSRGIGRAIAGHLAELGAHVVVHGTTPTSTRQLGEAESLGAVADEIAATHDTDVLAIDGDLTDVAVVQALVKQIHERFGRIDILVNNAGGDIGAAGVTGPLAGKPALNDALEIPLEDVRAILDRNLMSCILVTRAVVPHMRTRREGWIVNVGSTDGLWGQPSSVTYSVAKAAVHEYTRCLAAQLRTDGVRANALAPGDILTARFEASREIDETRRADSGSLTRYGSPVEVARAVEFLVTEDSSYVTGQVLRVDGGEQLWPA